jgi:hypothetical protein
MCLDKIVETSMYLFNVMSSLVIKRRCWKWIPSAATYASQTPCSLHTTVLMVSCKARHPEYFLFREFTIATHFIH